MPVRKAANTATHLTRHAVGPIRRAATGPGRAIVPQLSALSGAAVGKSASRFVKGLIGPH
jgi:hypothetical protein